MGTFDYVVTDGALTSEPATVSIDVADASAATVIYVSDIRFEMERWRGQPFVPGRFWGEPTVRYVDFSMCEAGPV